MIRTVTKSVWTKSRHTSSSSMLHIPQVLWHFWVTCKDPQRFPVGDQPDPQQLQKSTETEKKDIMRIPVH